MRKVIWLMVLCIVILVGCGKKEPAETTVNPETETEVVILGEDQLEILAPTVGKEEPTAPTVRTELLEIQEHGSFSGRYIEDGSDEPVENVACALIRNTGDRYLDYGVVRAMGGDEEYSFVVTGIPGGDAVWVLERDRKTVEEGTSLVFLDEEVSQLRDAFSTDERVSVDLLDGKVAVTNESDKTLSSVRIYYKQVYSDGNFLGGITYTCVTEELHAGATVEVTGGHSRGEGCAVVRVDVTE